MSNGGSPLILAPSPSARPADRTTSLARTYATLSATFLGSTLAHDMSQPLSAINMMAGACLKLAETDSGTRALIGKRLDLLAREAQRAVDMLRSFRQSVPHLSDQFADIDLKAVLTDLVDMVAEEGLDDGIAVTFSPGASPCLVHADPTLVEVAVYILCRNSLEAIRTCSRKRKEIAISLLAGPGTATIRVEDTGPGVDAAVVADRLFEPFTTTRSGNVGIGLSVCRSIMTSLGGSVSLESTSGNGTAFALELPSLPEQIDPEAERPRAKRATKARLLVVDDDSAIRRSLSEILVSASFDVETYATAHELLAALNSGQDADCVISDVRMPEMSGLELLNTMARHKKNVPVLLMTGYGDIPMAVRAMKAGAVDFIEKPLNADYIVRAVTRATEPTDDEEDTAARARFKLLTRRERETFDLIVLGHTNKSAASLLSISPRTVEVHRANIMEKMEAASLAELVRMSILLKR